MMIASLKLVWRRLPAIAALAIVGTMLFPQVLLALSEEQTKVLQSNIRYFNVKETTFVRGCSNGSGSSTLAGNSNDEKIWNYLIGKGLTAIQAAGIMGNFQAESGFDPTIVQGGSHSDTITIDGETGYGIAQWTSKGRQQALYNFATQGGKPDTNVSDLLVQLDYMYLEATTGAALGTWDDLKEQTTIENATLLWHNSYEASADGPEKIQGRINFAHDNFDKFGSSGGATSSSPGSSACGTNGSGEVVGGYSLPLDRRFYDEKPGNFSAKHHTFPAVDIPVAEGTNVYAVSPGTIIAAPVGGDCGLGVLVKRDDGVEFKYCHGTDGGNVPSAKNGDKVIAGQLIMHAGSTGESTGPHLHFEVIVDGTNRCPGPLLDGIAKGTPPDPGTLPTSGCVE